MLYNNLSGYLKRKYGVKVGKICIDGGFSCPNRDGTLGYGGCVYCGHRGAGEHIELGRSITEQVQDGLERGRSEGYIAYFQSFTNTYAPVPVLRERYNSALVDPRILVLAVGTRPDCIDRERAELLAEISERTDIWVELGLQTASDKTARLINRCYPTETYFRCAELLREYRLPFVTHLILGLPGEGHDDYMGSVDAVNSSGGFGVKLHSLYVSRDTALADMYARGEFTPITREEYITAAADSLARLDPGIVVHRLTGDCPDGMLIAPDWNRDKNQILQGIRDSLTSRGLRQGAGKIENEIKN